MRRVQAGLLGCKKRLLDGLGHGCAPTHFDVANMYQHTCTCRKRIGEERPPEARKN